MKLLIVDDDIDDCDIFSEAIRDINPTIQIEFASNGEEALKKLRSSEALPSYIFLDINMPKMNGKACLREIKKDERLKNIMVVVYSTTQDKEEINVVKYLGAEYMHKSSSYIGLKKSLTKYLKKPEANAK